MSDAKNGIRNGDLWRQAMTILAMVGGVAAIFMPLKQAIDSLAARTERHVMARGHEYALEELAAMKVQFAEVETQFRMAKSEYTLLTGQNCAHIEAMEKEITYLRDLITRLDEHVRDGKPRKP